MVTVCAVLSALERAGVEAAGDGCFVTLPADSVRQALRAARQRPVDALVVSVVACPDAELLAIARFIDQFPGICTVALVSRQDSTVCERLLHLGASGVRLAVDCTAAAGWHRLRTLVAHSASPERPILTRLRPALVDATQDMRRFLETLARVAPEHTHVLQLARCLGVPSSTLIARFRRARLPSPKAYLAGMRLLHAAHLFASPGLSVANVASRLASSAPSLRKHLRLTLGLTPHEFGRRFPFAVALEDYVERLITPYRETLRTFCPLKAGVWGHGSNVTRASRTG